MCHYFLGCSKDFLFIFGFQPLIIPSCMVFFVLILLCVCRAFWICTCFSPFGKSELLFLIVLFFLLYSFLSGNSVNSHYIFWYCPTGPKGSFLFAIIFSLCSSDWPIPIYSPLISLFFLHYLHSAHKPIQWFLKNFYNTFFIFRLWFFFNNFLYTKVFSLHSF